MRKPILPVFLVLVLAAGASAQTATHRWSFNSTGAVTNGTVIPDAIGGAAGTIVGTGASRNGSTLLLPGSTNGNLAATSISAYFDLPNSIISSKTDLTVEIWATPIGSRSWQRLFDFGRVNVNASGGGEINNTSAAPGAGLASSDNLMLALQRGTDFAQQRLAARLDGGGEFATNNSVTLVPGTESHFIMTFQAGVGANAATGGRCTWYRDGGLVGSFDTNFRLYQIEDVNNWLGRSQYTDDSNSNISYNEVRIYSGAMAVVDQAASRRAGVDAAMTPVAVADSVTMLPGTKAGIPVLLNDSGQAFPSTVQITSGPTKGSATVMADGRILYTHTNLTATADSFTYRVRGGSGIFSNAVTVAIAIQSSPKVPNPNLNVPSSPPATALSLVNAFPLANDDTGGLDFTNPLCLRTPPGETKRLFVLEKGGVIRLVPDVTAAVPSQSEFFNLANLVNPRATEDFTIEGECGLLGLAFHPQYATNRKFYVFYSLLINGVRYQRVSRFLTQSDNASLADTTTEQILIQQLDEANNHNGGDLHFGPNDGFLYISVGDEGNANDDPNFNSQLINKDLFSGILRIDVDKASGLAPTAHASIPTDANGARFSIPLSNPFVLPANGGNWDGTYNGSTVTGTVRREFWATGLRNPWRMSFDPVTGALWCGDVGQSAREEIDIIARGGNYGWVYREGNITGPRTTNPTMPANFDLLYHNKPLYDYPRGGLLGGYSVTGGLVYRGTSIPSLTGKYIFGDYGSGNIWSLNLDGTGITRIAGEGGIVAFGTDPSNGDVLLADIDNNRILRLAQTPQSTTFPETLSATGLFAELSDLSPSPGLIPYDVNVPFWSDYAVKRRWFIVPDGISKFGWAQNGSWTLPAGTVWVKHFDMEMQRGVAASKKRIETRVIVKNPTGAYGVSYRWNDAGTEATLAADGGENFTLAVTENGNPVPQTWRIPSRAECMVCHNAPAGRALSFETRQLNRDSNILGFSGNQLTTLSALDYFTSNPGTPNLLPRHLRPTEDAYSVEARVRSYLAVNCSYCHRPGGTAPTAWDGRAEISLAATGLVLGSAASNNNDPGNKLVVPGSTAHSIVWNRIGASNGFTRMPPLASNVIDQQAVDLLTVWITGELNASQSYAEWRLARFGSATSPEGALAADPDGDGFTNEFEYLAGTQPLSGTSALRPSINVTGGNFTFAFPLPVNRSFRIKTSSDLLNWATWDIPQNQGLPVNGQLIQITRPQTGTPAFFKVEVLGN